MSYSNTIEKENNRVAQEDGWNIVYQKIREKCDREANEKHYETGESERPQNRGLNRYRDVNPYDHSRIIIHRGNVDYINANLVKLERAGRKYILTQGPLPDTVGHFWLMVWEQQTVAILMLNKLMEKKQIKCHLYWPEKRGMENAIKLEDVKLRVEFLRCEEYKNYTCRWFKLSDVETNQSREIIQFHYTTWPDFGIPSSPVAFLQFLKQVRDSGALDPDVGPAVVHCSAGIGRSGTFCLVDCCLVLIDKEGEANVSVQDILCELRRYRMGLIQTADQLYFSYQAIIEGIKLLKDSNFLDYKESPIPYSDEQQEDQYNMDETPPPLPPRTHSLLPLAGNAGGVLTLNLRSAQNNKQLPTGTSDSFNDALYPRHEQNLSSKDALNNFINNEKSSEHMSNRPLPPLPGNQHLASNLQDRMHESESDMYESSDDDGVDNDSGDDNKNENNDNVNESKLKSNNAEERSNAANISQQNTMTTQNRITHNAIEAQENSAKWNGSDSRGESEIRHRKHAERQAEIEHKVNEIKRKQKEFEAGKSEAKKRRSLVAYITAGVVVGVICVYAYSKLG